MEFCMGRSHVYTDFVCFFVLQITYMMKRISEPMSHNLHVGKIYISGRMHKCRSLIDAVVLFVAAFLWRFADAKTLRFYVSSRIPPLRKSQCWKIILK
jgi:hypothetical protein